MDDVWFRWAKAPGLCYIRGREMFRQGRAVSDSYENPMGVVRVGAKNERSRALAVRPFYAQTSKRSVTAVTRVTHFPSRLLNNKILHPSRVVLLYLTVVVS